MSGEFSANPDDDFETEWQEEIRHLRAQLAAALSQIQEMYATMKATDLSHAAELAKVTGLLRDLVLMTGAWSFSPNSHLTAGINAAWDAAHRYLNPPHTQK